MREKENIRLSPSLLRKIDYTILFLTIIVILMLCIDLSYELPYKWKLIFGYVDAVICFLFLAEFFFKLNFAHSKSKYLKRHWIDLISSIPFLLALRWGRLVRLFRILRILRVGVLLLKSAERTMDLFAQHTLGFIATTCTFMITTAAFAFFLFEKGQNPNIPTFWDALWWSIVTVTTVGYGDITPVTVGGRLVGAALMVGGMGVFATFTAMIATFLIRRRERGERLIYEELLNRIEELSKKVEKERR
jgi:voltage-gated potassium channel